MGIPLLDLRGLSKKEEDIQELAAELNRAFTDIGFLAVTNHCVKPETLKEAWKNADAFLNLPRDIKVRHKKDLSIGKKGWTDLNTQFLYNPGKAERQPVPDLREAVDINHATFEWPPELPELKESTTNIMEELSTLGNYVLLLMAVALKLEDRDYFTKNHNLLAQDNPTSACFIHYPPIPNGGLEEGQTRCGEHTDWGSITLLIQDENGGLEVQTESGEWIESHPPTDAVIINIGDMMQMWTADCFVSTNHRVPPPKNPEIKRRLRRSLAYFVWPDGNIIVDDIMNKKKYPPIKSSSYLWQRYNQHYD